MLLFGGALSGDKTRSAKDTDAHVSADKAPRAASPEESPPTPHTEALHRLTNHELRLLEELERTRSRLEAEWRVKLAELQQDQPDIVQTLFQHGMPSVEQLTQVFLVPDAVRSSPLSTRRRSDDDSNDPTPKPTLSVSSIRKKVPLHQTKPKRQAVHHREQLQQQQQQQDLPAKTRDIALPRLHNRLDIVPLLTTSAQTPFEVGLSPHEGGSHMLPVFRLPAVGNVQAIASAIASKEVAQVAEDQDKKLASEKLGLSMDEIEMLEAQLNGVSPARRQVVATGPSNPLSIRALPGLSHKKNDRSKKVAKTKKTQPKRKRAAFVDRGEALRLELESALYNVQHLTRLVKDDIFAAQRICPASELRTSGIAFERWRDAVAFEKQQEKLQAYLMYKGSKKLDLFLLNWTNRKLRQAWTTWAALIAYQKALERAARELEAIEVIQRAFRGYRGRRIAYLIKMKQRLAKETDAALVIQRHFRGSISRRFFRLKRLHLRRERAARAIQALGRGFLVRHHVRRLRRERRQHAAASRIQALHRGRRARREVSRRQREQRVTNAAVLIQRRYRGRLGRAKFLRRRIEMYRASAATKIQKIARGWLARRLLRRLQEERRQELARQNAAALEIQRVYRGHRSRLGTQLKLLALREKNRMRYQAAVKIQRVARARQARHTVDRLRREKLAQLVALARRWGEYWSDDTAQWFYHNHETGEALWAPPSTGYTKSDGRLVLQSGKIIDDPGDMELGDTSLAFHDRKKPLAPGQQDDTLRNDADSKVDDEEEDEEDEDRLCVECEEADALRRCDQCQDVYCDECFEKLHRASAKREKHTWKAMGSMRCIECEKMKATRWCFVCEDPYCLGCFNIIHSKGNKAQHEWTDMATFRKQQKMKQRNARSEDYSHAALQDENAQTYDEFMRSHEYEYVTALATEEAYTTPASGASSYYTYGTASPAATGAGAGAGAAEAEWTTLYDENSGQYYYYNNVTGESRWA
ncbi:hypothetical protein P43SY_002191 [Pythium insidiosum]|uniref:WW domain-containing protein n=1 Tax=Pythium insidiosum TaxID=114742 RepID=A0AAD5LSJ5_PYTIN|nr:hypothetical protein P43SY_002191 [Pythium insidiosum]